MNLTRFKHFKSEFKIRKIFEQFNILNNSNIEKSKSEAQYHLYLLDYCTCQTKLYQLQLNCWIAAVILEQLGCEPLREASSTVGIHHTVFQLVSVAQILRLKTQSYHTRTRIKSGLQTRTRTRIKSEPRTRIQTSVSYELCR